METTWQREDVTQHYLEQVRGGIPFGAEQAGLMLQIVDHFVKEPKTIMDLGCGNGLLAKYYFVRTLLQMQFVLIIHHQ